MDDQVSKQTRYLGFLVTYVGNKPITTWRIDLMGDRFPKDRNCRLIEYMFEVDNLTAGRTGTLHRVMR